MTDTIVDWAKLEPREVIAGFRGRFAHSERMTFTLWDIAEGAVLPRHSHEHEQVINVLEGRFEATVDGVTTILSAGMVGVVPPWAEHSGRALADCRILDVFAPVRADYQSGSAESLLQRAVRGD